MLGCLMIERGSFAALFSCESCGTGGLFSLFFCSSLSWANWLISSCLGVLSVGNANPATRAIASAIRLPSANWGWLFSVSRVFFTSVGLAIGVGTMLLVS